MGFFSLVALAEVAQYGSMENLSNKYLMCGCNASQGIVNAIILCKILLVMCDNTLLLQKVM